MMRIIDANQALVANREMVEENVDVNDHRRNVPKRIRLDFPHFNGYNPIGWVFKANQYFDLHRTIPAHRLLMASYHMESEALIWYQDAYKSR